MATNPTEISRNLEMQEIGNQSRESTDINQNDNLEEVVKRISDFCISIAQSDNLEEVVERTSDCCIYRIPRHFRNINEEGYTPKLVSIGPLHYSRIELNEMEKHKRMYQSRFRERITAQKWEEFETYIKEKEQCIRSHYLVISNMLSLEYMSMILCDAVFIIELFISYYFKYYHFFLHNSQLLEDLRIDLLLLENQLPYFVLNELYMKAFGNCGENLSFFDLSIKFFGGIKAFNWSFSVQPKVKHFTDLLRHIAVKDAQVCRRFHEKRFNNKEIIGLPNATTLEESGLRFKGIETKCMLDISCVKRDSCWKWLSCCKVFEVQIPCIEVYDETECLLRNMMALEAFYYPNENYVCNYADLIDYLIDTAKDVDLLVKEGIIIDRVGNTKAIAKMFNRLCSDIGTSCSCYYEIAENMKAHYNYPFNHIITTLKSVYFSNLWTGTATIAAIFLLIFTLIQTICSIIQVSQGYTQK